MIETIQKKLEKLYKDQSCIIAAVSGGADSVALLLMLHSLREKMGFQLKVLHVEHGIRGEESKQDANFVENLCLKLQIPCCVREVDAPSFAKEYGIGLEEAARLLRYKELSAYGLQEQGCIALAHHMEDNVETILFQYIRGCALSGLCGMEEKRQDENGVWFIRPLLDLRRADIEAYLEEQQQDFCVDSTNKELDYSRNYMRMEIIPKLARINEKAVPHIHRTATYLDEIRDFLYCESKRHRRSVCQEDGDKIKISIEKLEQIHPVLQKEIVYDCITRSVGRKKDITQQHVEDVLALLRLQSGRSIRLPFDTVVKREFQNLVFQKEIEEPKLKDAVVVSAELLQLLSEKLEKKTIDLGQGEKISLRVFQKDEILNGIPEKPYTKWFDCDKIKNSFCIRRRDAGDFFVCDKEGHHKKLKTYFIDEKIPMEERNQMWLLAEEHKVLWLVGKRISEDIKIDEYTKRVIEVQYMKGET